MENSTKKPSFLIALLCITFLFVIIIAQVLVAGSPDIHMTLVFSTTFAVLVLMLSGTKWSVIEDGILHGCKIATVPMLILMFIGMLIPALIASGTIPALIYYGLKIINPSVFLLTTALICAVSSVCTGSSYTTGGTFGVAFMGISIGLGIPPALTAGAVISGAVIGDKLSPLSDSTNLAAGVCETNLFAHIKSMLYTTVPAFIISLIIYTVLGMKYSADSIDTSAVDAILKGIGDNFNVSPLYTLISLIPLAAVVFMAAKKVSALAAMIIAALIAMVIAMIMQGYSILEMMSFMNYGYTIDTGVAAVDKLLNRGGIQAMMWTVSLGYLGLSYGGILEVTGTLEALINKMEALTKSARNLIVTHILSSILINIISASQYVAIIIPGRMYLPAYKKIGIRTDVASRTCEDSGTVTSPLVPWGLCGVFFTGTLGVNTLEYLPYAFLCYLTPVVAIIYALTGKFIWREEPSK
ncbi:Na+/H+ antiporter NhaC [Sinanaerobacter sp. ZZT-01]|uniref:Na+/H+ antiporter NhaC n=1 Tax=Sinanaerobacter sp. ZZT-01 TaxID=3111540 RepID=UPI002D790389|nr:Na+/H+ antiporter NhaC [Sinanaerobacter sp. ZZT-01]WRR92227.1 Na+/H+ antiporter NhaC [Sinanaerobacter sp. ZZT-01]